MSKELLAPVKSLGELSKLAHKDPRYAALAKAGAENLGGSPKTLEDAMQYLYNECLESDDETGVVEEVNFVRDLL